MFGNLRDGQISIVMSTCMLFYLGRYYSDLALVVVDDHAVLRVRCEQVIETYP